MYEFFVTSMLIAALVLLLIALLAAERLVRTHHGQKVDFFRKYPIQPEDIVFLGDSLTDGCRWDELFPGFPVKNRGINADTTAGVLERISDITGGKPKAIFILIGTNDLPWYLQRENEDILSTYEEILERIRLESPHTRVFVQSLLPRAARYARRIKILNQRLKRMAERRGLTFVDVYPRLAAPDGSIRPELSNDRLHLMGSGYQIWAEVLRPHLESLR